MKMNQNTAQLTASKCTRYQS